MSAPSNIISQQSTTGFESCKENIQANWQKHRVAILAGTAIAAGGLAIALTGGLAALPAALGTALFFSGTFAAAGGFAFTGYMALSQPKKENAKPSDNEEKKPDAISASKEMEVKIPERTISPAPSGTHVQNLMKGFLNLPEEHNPSRPIATIEDVPEEDEIVEKEPNAVFLDLENFSPTISLNTPSSLSNDDIPEDLLLYREDEKQTEQPSASTISSSIPSCKTTRKLLGYTLVGAAAVAATAYGINRWNELTDEEKQAYLSQLRDGAEYLSASVRDGLSKMSSSLDIFSQEGNPTTLSFGTDATNRLPFFNSCSAQANPTTLSFDTDTTGNFLAPDASRRGYVEYYGPRMMSLANDAFSSVSSFFGNMVSPTSNLTGDPTTLSLGTDATNRPPFFAAPLDSCAAQANPTTLSFGTDTTGDLSTLDASRRGYVEYYGTGVMNLANSTISSVSSFVGNTASSLYNQLPSGEDIVGKMNHSAASWGQTGEEWTQWASNADPFGKLSESLAPLANRFETCSSAASEYLTGNGAPGTVASWDDFANSCSPTPLEIGALSIAEACAMYAIMPSKAEEKASQEEVSKKA